MGRKIVGPVIASVGALLYILSPFLPWFSAGFFGLSLRDVLARGSDSITVSAVEAPLSVISIVLLVAGIVALVYDLAEIAIPEKGFFLLCFSGFFFAINIGAMLRFVFDYSGYESGVSMGVGFVIFIVSLILQLAGAIINHVLRKGMRM